MPDSTGFATAEDCPDKAKHTKKPMGYLAWCEWADNKAKTHDNVQCPTCGFYAMWVPRSAAIAVEPAQHNQDGQA